MPTDTSINALSGGTPAFRPASPAVCRPATTQAAETAQGAETAQDTDKAQGPAGAPPARDWSRVTYRLLKITIGPYLRVLGRPRVCGLEHIPDGGGVILASNHLSFLDSLFLGLVVRRRVTFLAKSEYFTTPGVRGWFKRIFFSASGQISIDRNNERRAAVGMRRATELLRQGELLGIYPEGTRSPDGQLYRGRTGVARAALTAAAPVLPVAMIGTFQVLPADRRLPRRGRVEIHVGPPVDLAVCAGLTGVERHRALTDEIMRAIGKLSNQPYVDRYAREVKAELGLAVQR